MQIRDEETRSRIQSENRRDAAHGIMKPMGEVSYTDVHLPYQKAKKATRENLHECTIERQRKATHLRNV